MRLVVLQVNVNGVFGGVPRVRLTGVRAVADWVEVEVLLDSRLLDGGGRKSGMGFFPYFLSGFRLFCLLLKKVSGDLLVLFLLVGDLHCQGLGSELRYR